MMASKISFDNHILDLLLLPANQPRIQPILDCVARGAIEFYATHELVGEASGVVENKPHLLTNFGAVIGHLTEGRHLLTPEGAAIAEFRGAPAYGSDYDRNVIYGYWVRLASGKPNLEEVRRVADEAKRLKNEALAGWRKLTAEGRARMDAATEEDQAAFMATPFAEVDQKQWAAQGRNTALRFAQEAGALDPEAVADAVMADPASFPLTRRFVRVLALLLWWWYAGSPQGHAVDGGDQNDARQLTLLPALDHFITNDKAIKKWSEILGDPADKVLTFDEFLSRTWC